LFPEHVYLICGNHEIEGEYSLDFWNECKGKYYKKTGDKDFPIVIYDLFKFLPLAAVINGKSFCVHGGINKDTCLKMFERIPKPRIEVLKNDIDRIVSGLLWSDPSEKPKSKDGNFLPNSARAGKNPGFSSFNYFGDWFNATATKLFLQRDNLNQIIRTHEKPKNNKGYEKPFGDNTCITVFSTANYAQNRETNDGAILQINVDWATNKQVITAMPFFKDAQNNYKVIWRDIENVE
jgi:diadenosine tetraphosphatase ApaH/serine/threonine PP2A family protein phosphatase